MANELKPGDVVWISRGFYTTGIGVDYLQPPFSLTIISQGGEPWLAKDCRGLTWGVRHEWIDWFMTNVYRRRHGK